MREVREVLQRSYSKYGLRILQEKINIFYSLFIPCPGEEPLCPFLLHSWKGSLIEQFRKEVHLFCSSKSLIFFAVGSMLC